MVYFYERMFKINDKKLSANYFRLLLMATAIFSQKARVVAIVNPTLD